ncbi:MAG: LptF/LptG family permease [Oligosphaeraceae bacterium]
MRIINGTIAKNLLGTLLMALGILTFVMMSVHLFRIFAMLANGLSPRVMGKILLCLLPDVLRYALPFSILVSTVLVFSRMSADNELVALKASGVSLWQITAPGLALALVLCGAGVWLGMVAAPALRYEGELLKWQTMGESSLALLEPGASTFLAGQQVSVRIGSKDPESGLLRDVHIYQLGKGGESLRAITAEAARVQVRPEERDLQLTLYRFTVAQQELPGGEAAPPSGEETAAPESKTPGFLAGETLTLHLEYGTIQDRKSLGRKLKMMPVTMLFGDLLWNRSQGNSVSRHWYEFHYRLALAFSPLAFLLLGIPFGIRNRRSETSSGLLICLGMALAYYGVILLCDALVRHPELHPEFLIWAPNLLYQIGGLAALARLSRH